MNFAHDDIALRKALLERIEAWPLADPLAPIGFEDRLADENRWTRGFALRVVAEYRRFLCLTQVAGHVVTPSREVDAAWHLHLTCTRDYRAMCEALFGRFLHHEPSKGGGEQLAHYQDLYQRTLESYRQAFGEDPPADIWPPVELRFAPLPVESPEASVGSMTLPRDALPGAIALSALAGVGAWLVGVRGPWLAWTGTEWLLACALALIGVGLLARWTATSALRRDRRAPPLDAEEVAWLAGGRGRVALGVITRLVTLGVLRLLPERGDDGKIRIATLERTDRDVGRASLEPAARRIAAMPAGLVSPTDVLDGIAAPCREIDLRLRRAGLRGDEGRLTGARLATLALSLGVLAFSCHRLTAGLANFQPAVLLHAALIALNLWQVSVLSRGRELTGLGEAAFAQASAPVKAWQSRRQARACSADEGPGAPAFGSMLSLAAAVVGTAAVVDDPQFAGINFVIPDGPGQVTGTSGSVAGCEAVASCGGCGGCGGCG